MRASFAGREATEGQAHTGTTRERADDKGSITPHGERAQGKHKLGLVPVPFDCCSRPFRFCVRALPAAPMNQTNILRILGAWADERRGGPSPSSSCERVALTHPLTHCRQRTISLELPTCQALCPKTTKHKHTLCRQSEPRMKNEARSPRPRPPIGPYVLISRDLKSEGGGALPPSRARASEH